MKKNKFEKDYIFKEKILLKLIKKNQILFILEDLNHNIEMFQKYNLKIIDVKKVLYNCLRIVFHIRYHIYCVYYILFIQYVGSTIFLFILDIKYIGYTIGYFNKKVKIKKLISENNIFSGAKNYAKFFGFC